MMLLRILGASCKSPNSCILTYKDGLQRTGCGSIEVTVYTGRVLGAGALLRSMGDHRLPKRVLSGELKSVGQRGPEGEGVDELRGRGSLELWHHGELLEYRRTRPWGFVQPSMRRGLLQVRDRLGEGRRGKYIVTVEIAPGVTV